MPIFILAAGPCRGRHSLRRYTMQVVLILILVIEAKHEFDSKKGHRLRR